MAEQRTRRRFTAEFKAEAVKRLLSEQQMLFEAVCAAFGRIAEMETVRAEIVAHMAAPVSATEQPAAEMNGSEPPGEE